MATSDTIQVMRRTSPLLTRQMLTFRDDTNPTNPADITGWLIKLMVKSSFVMPGLNPFLLSDQSAFFDLPATLLTPTSGVYQFQLVSAHTVMPAGIYPGVIRWWMDGISTDVPDDAIFINYIVSENPAFYS